jgi:hypothetical protein
MKKIHIIVIAILILTLFNNRVFAESTPESRKDIKVSSSIGSSASLEITSSPMVELRTTPGSSDNGHVTLKNTGSDSVQLKIYVQDYSLEDGEVIYSDPDPDKPFTSAAWFKLSDSEALLAPGGYIDLSYTLNTPANASPGAHWAVIFFETVQVNKQKVNGGVRIGATVINTVEGEFVYKANVLSSSIGKWAKRQIPYSFLVENKGNMLLKVKPLLTVTSWNGSVHNIPLDEVTVYPDEVNTVQGAWASPRFFGIYNLDFKLDYYDSKAQEHFQQKILIIPWHWLLAGIGIVLVLRIRHAILKKKTRPDKLVYVQQLPHPGELPSMQPWEPAKPADSELNQFKSYSRTRKKALGKPRTVWWGYHIPQVNGYLAELDGILHETLEEQGRLKDRINTYSSSIGREKVNIRLERKNAPPEDKELKRIKSLLKEIIGED